MVFTLLTLLTVSTSKPAALKGIVTSTWEKYTVKLDVITSITTKDDRIIIEGYGPDVSSTITLHTSDVPTLWRSIKDAQNNEIFKCIEDKMK